MPWVASASSVVRSVVLLAIVGIGAAQAGDDRSTTIRVIEITRDSAERSAAALRAANSPFIGMPPQGKRVDRRLSDWQDAHAGIPRSKGKVARKDDRMKAAARVRLPEKSDAAVVEIVTRGKGEPVLKTYLVPRGESAR